MHSAVRVASGGLIYLGYASAGMIVAPGLQSIAWDRQIVASVIDPNTAQAAIRSEMLPQLVLPTSEPPSIADPGHTQE